MATIGVCDVSLASIVPAVMECRLLDWSDRSQDGAWWVVEYIPTPDPMGYDNLPFVVARCRTYSKALLEWKLARARDSVYAAWIDSQTGFDGDSAAALFEIWHVCVPEGV